MFTETSVATMAATAEPVAPPAPRPMSAVVDRASLAAAVAIVGRAVESRSTIPVLQAIRLKEFAGAIFASATDLDLTISAPVSGSADPGFDVGIPAKQLAATMKSAKAADMVGIDVTFTGDRAKVALDFAGLKVTLPGWPAADIPEVRTPEVLSSFILPRADLVRLFDGVAFAISTEETRYYLNGAFLHAHTAGGGANAVTTLRAVATDGHRLAQVDVPMPAGAESFPAAIVPHAAVAEVSRLVNAKGAPESVVVQARHGGSAGAIVFGIGEVEVWTKAIDGTFPDYCRVVPKGNPRRLAFDPAAMAGAISQVEAVTGKARALRLAMAEGFPVALSGNNPDLGEASTSIVGEFDGRDGADPKRHRPEMVIGFNSAYLRDMCGRIDGPAEMLLADEGSPTLIRAVGDTASLFVLMPMRVA